GAEGPGRDFRLDPRLAPPGREFSPKSSESPEVRPEPRVAAPPIDGSDELMPRERRPVAEGPRRPGEPPPPVVPESDEVTLSPRTPPSPPPPRPALSLPPSIAEVFGSKSWSESRPDATVGAEAPSAPRPDMRQDARPEPAPGSFDALWPADPGLAKPKAEGPQSGPKLEGPRADETSGQEKRGDAQPSAILKSGVIDGMACTLYTDGSITADLPQGTVRFASVEALRAHLDKGGSSS